MTKGSKCLDKGEFSTKQTGESEDNALVPRARLEEATTCAAASPEHVALVGG